MQDRTLAISIWISIALHLLAFLIPGPGEARETRSITVAIEWLPPVASVDDRATVEAALIEGPAESTEDPGIPEELPLEPLPALPPPLPEPAHRPPEPPQSLPLPEIATTLLERPSPPPIPEAAPPPPPPPEPAAPEGAAEPDPDRVEALLRATEESVRNSRAEERYRFVEVRERVRLALESAHPGARAVAADAARYRAILRFSVDAEGAIHDLELRLPPGGRLDARAIEWAVASLNLPPPPAECAAPLTFEWRLDFVD